MIKQEIERRWLMRHPLIDIRPDEVLTIEQWYTDETFGAVRYRKSSSRNTGEVIFEKIIKYNISPGVNSEESVPIHGDKFAREVEPGMKYIKKTRRVYDFGGLKFEVDDFSNIKLCICEVELKMVEDLSKEIKFHPDLEPLIIKEITGDKAFSNFELARSQY